MAKAKEKVKKEKSGKSAKTAKAEKPAKAPKPAKAAKPAKVAKAKSADVAAAEPVKPTKISKAEHAAVELTEEEQQLVKKWQKLQKQYAEEKPQAYTISGFFDVKTPINHKVHGWGVVLNRRENYIDVLFESGMKTLIINFKG